MPPREWSSRPARMLLAAATVTSLLQLPPLAYADQPASSVHVVQPGETLSQIAADAGIDAATLAALNGLDDPNLLSVGQSLKLKATAPSQGPRVTAPRAAARTYTIADGDTLSAIAQQLGTTTDAIVQLNKLDDADHLALGTVLTLPAAATSGATSTAATSGTAAPVRSTPSVSSGRSVLVSYTVQPGETLSQIARQFDARSDAVAQASGLDDPNKLSVGTVLKLPVPAKEHVVAAGETLRDIAAAEKVDLGSLIDFNQLDDPELIRVGQVVLVPVPATLQTAAAGPVVAEAPAPAPKPTPAPAHKPAAPVAVVAPPPGAPTDGPAGAGLKLLGAPYIWGGSSPSGFDCSGFVWYVARQVGKSISRGLLGEYNSGSHPSRDELKVGDLVFFQNTYTPGLSHNGIYIGSGRFVHAADETAGVTTSSLDTAYWSSHWFGATRLP